MDTHLVSKAMESATRVQILNEAECFSIITIP